MEHVGAAGVVDGKTSLETSKKRVLGR